MKVSIYRRSLLRSLCTTLLAPNITALAQSTDADAQEAGEGAIVEKWLVDAAQKKKNVDGGLGVFKFYDYMWAMLSPISWRPPEPNSENLHSVIVPRGFVTDFASIPRPFWIALAPDDEYGFAAIVHDYLYWIQDRTREEANSIFEFALRDLEVTNIKRSILMTAVSSSFGAKAWENNRLAKQRGERRLLREFPTDPRVKWVDWRKNPDVLQ